MWYTIYQTSTGQIRGHGTVLPDTVNPAFTVINHGEDRKDQLGIWNAGNKQWESRPLARRISVSDFLLRMTESERALYYDVDNKNGRTVEKAIASAGRIGFVDLGSQSVSGMLDILISEGVIHSDRKGDILA